MGDECTAEWSSDDSEYNYIREPDFILDQETEIVDEDDEDCSVKLLYSDEPLADQKWQDEYSKRQREKEERENSLIDRFQHKIAVSEWCSCGHCNTDLLQNAYECFCCSEIEKCVKALKSDLVLGEVSEVPKCVTSHPGFNTICLDRWSLRMAASKYRTMDRKVYKQTGSENAFLRSVSYREFTHLVHGRLGRVRIPLPACAYCKIRKKLGCNDEYKGFDEE